MAGRKVRARTGAASYRMDVLLRPPLDRVAVRDGPGRLGAELLLRLERPVRLPEQLPRQEHQVGVAAGHDLVGVPGLGDQPDRTGHYLRLVTNLPGERHLVPLAHRNASLRDEPARGNVDQVNAQLLQ